MGNRFSLLSNQTYGSYIGELKNSQTSLMELVTNKMAMQSNQNIVSQALSAPSVLSGNPLANNLINPIVIGNALSSMRLGNQIAGEIDYSTDRMVGSLDTINDSINHSAQLNALSNILGAVMTSGTIAISAGLIISQMKELKSGIERLGSIFTEGMSLISTKLDLQNHIMSNIEEQLEKINNTLNSPTMTKAKEQRNIGLDRLSNDLIPEAKEAFVNALSYDDTDAISNLMLGKIYLDGIDNDCNFHDPQKAMEYFQKATRYANAFYKKIPELRDTKADSMYLSSLTIIASDKSVENMEKALKSINDLLKEFPEHTQGSYLKIKLLIKLNRKDEAVEECNSLINRDFTYIGVASNDEDFQTSDIGKVLIENMMYSYNVQIFDYSEAIKELAYQMSLLKIKVNPEITKYLDKYFDKYDRDFINNPSNEILALLMLFEVSCNALVKEKYHEYMQEIEQLKTSTLNLIEQINFEYVDSDVQTEIPLNNKYSAYSHLMSKDITDIDIKDILDVLNDLRSINRDMISTLNFSVMSQNTLNKYRKLMEDKVSFFNDMYDSNARFFGTIFICILILFLGGVISLILFIQDSEWLKTTGKISMVLTLLTMIGYFVKKSFSTEPTTNEKHIEALGIDLMMEIQNNSSNPLSISFQERLLDKFLA